MIRQKIIFCICLLWVFSMFSNSAVGRTEVEYLNLFQTHIEGLAQDYYLPYAYDFSSLAVSIYTQGVKQQTTVTSIYEKLKQIETKLKTTDRPPTAEHLRDASLLIAELKAIQEKTKHDVETFYQLQDLSKQQCQSSIIAQHASEFDGACNAVTTPLINELNASIDNVLTGNEKPRIAQIQIQLNMQSTSKASNIEIQPTPFTSEANPELVYVIPGGLGVAGYCFLGPLGMLGGLAIGNIICSLFSEDIMSKKTESLKNDIQALHNALNRIHDEKISLNLLTRHCHDTFEATEFLQVFSQVSTQLSQQIDIIDQEVDQAKKTVQALETKYHTHLNQHLLEDPAIISTLFEEHFYKYAQRLGKQDVAVKKYANIKIAPHLKALLATSSKEPQQLFLAEHLLLDRLIEGDAFFSRQDTFSFIPTTHTQEFTSRVMYWDGLVKGILKTLEGKP